METRSIHAGCRFQILAVLVLGVLVVGASAAPAPIMSPQKKEPQKTVKFAMKDKTWREVLEWLAETTGKPMITSSYPKGRVSFEGPADKDYTIPEVIEIINQALKCNNPTQSYCLISRERSFTLIPTDEKIDLGLCCRVTCPADLEKHGDHELLIVVLSLKSLEAEDIAPQIKKMMGPFGEAIPMTHNGVNNLILFDSVDNLKLICQMLGQLEKPKPPASLPAFQLRTDTRFDPRDPRANSRFVPGDPRFRRE